MNMHVSTAKSIYVICVLNNVCILIFCQKIVFLISLNILTLDIYTKIVLFLIKAIFSEISQIFASRVNIMF